MSISSSVVKVEHGWVDKGEEDEGSMEAWDDGGGYTGIRSIIVGYSPAFGLETIQLEYDLFGKSVLGQEHGADNMKMWKLRGTAARKDQIFVEFPDEIVTSIYYEAGSNFPRYSTTGKRIYNLIMKTNRRTLTLFIPHGLLEVEKRSVVGDYPGAAIVGFFGRSNSYGLRSIGVYMAALTTAAAGDPLLHDLRLQELTPYRTSPLSFTMPPSTT